jgi:hypothetical protein
VYTPMSSNTLRTGKRIYRGVSESPNFKGATAVRPNESFKELAKKNKGSTFQRAAQRRLLSANNRRSTGKSG